MADSPSSRESTTTFVADQLWKYFSGCSIDDEFDRHEIARWFVSELGLYGKPLATFRYEEPPPSANNIYFVRGGRKRLTAKADAWKTRFVSVRGGLSVMELANLDLGIEMKFILDVWVYLDRGEIITDSYGKKKNTKYPYKQVDTSNFFKLAEDAVTELLGVSCDRQNFKIIGHKVPADHRGRRLVIHLFPYEDEVDPHDPG